MIIKAPAKINLGLDVLGHRKDGYHDVSMIMQSLTLHDTVTITAAPGKPGSLRGEIELTSSAPDIPTDETNLACKAARLLMDRFGITDTVRIDLRKNIPAAAGLGGGSADAAAVLVGVNRLFRLGLRDEELRREGVKIGADVPFCLMRGTAIAEGIGDILRPVAPMPSCGILLAKPPVSVSTKKVYQQYDSAEVKAHPDIPAILKALKEGSLESLAGSIGNVLEAVTAAGYPVIDELKESMIKEGALGSLMSGSGPTVFGLYRTEEEASVAAERLRAKWQGVRWIVTAPSDKEA